MMGECAELQPSQSFVESELPSNQNANLLELPENHYLHAYQLLQEDPQFDAFLKDSARTIVDCEATSRNPGKLPVER